MAQVALLAGLSQVIDRYDAILCDVWGVIHDGRQAFPDACEALRAFRQLRGPVVLVTNAPVPKERVTRLFPRLGVLEDCFDDVVASGDVTRTELLRFAPGPVYRIGLDEDVSLYQGLGLDFTQDPDKAKVICCTSLRDYPHGTPEPYREELRMLAGRGLPMICANPDVVFRQGDRLIWSAGALAEIFSEEGGSVIAPGKPHGPIYRTAFDRASVIAGRPIERSRFLAIGDGPATDIAGANLQGIDSLFIGSGIHGRVIGEGKDFIASASRVLENDRASATYAMHLLSW